MDLKSRPILEGFSPTVIEWRDLDKRKYYLIGPLTFVGLRGLVYPFNLIKTRLFMQKRKAVYSGTLNAFRTVLKYEGVRGLYKGFIPSSFGLISGQLYITTYEVTRSFLDGYSSGVRSFIGGFTASLLGQTVTVPVDIVSQHMMIQGQVNKDSPKKKVRLKGPLTVLRDIVRTEGASGLYRGYLVSLMTYVPSSAIWWGSYSTIYAYSSHHPLLSQGPTVGLIMGSGMLAGVVSASSTNLMDLVRTRYQLECSASLRQVVAKLWKEEGVRAAYKGISARIMQTVPTGALMIVGYEFVKRASLKT